jgi:hypothetical protein
VLSAVVIVVSVLLLLVVVVVVVAASPDTADTRRTFGAELRDFQAQGLYPNIEVHTKTLVTNIVVEAAASGAGAWQQHHPSRQPEGYRSPPCRRCGCCCRCRLCKR